MADYNYYEAVQDDIRDYIESEINFDDFEDMDELEEYLNETLFNHDSVTGNASGSYTFNAYKAEEYLCHNWDLLEEALEMFCDDRNPIEQGAEWCDVTIRCYILNSCIAEVLADYEEKFEEVEA